MPSLARSPLLGVLLLAITTGCAKRENLVDTGVKQQVLHAALKAEPRDLDPQIATSQEEFTLTKALMEGLTELDPITSRPIPGVAERWDVSPDGLTWTFHLRADARWSNGDPVTADDFVYGFRRMLTAALANEYAPQLHCLRGAADFHGGKRADFADVGARAVDARTLVLSLNHPVPYLPSLALLPAWFPAHRPTIEKFDALQRRGTAWTRPGNHVGNGAFVLADWKPNQVVRLKRSDTYWDRARVRLREVAFYPVDNLATQESMFRAGQLHVTSNSLNVEKVRAYREDPARAPLLHQGALLATKFFRFNTARRPLGDPRVRRALALALDRPALTRSILQNDLAAVAFTPPDCAGYTAAPGVATDVAEARRLLADAGFPEGRGSPRLELLFYPTGSSGQPVAEAVQQRWRTTLGLDIAVVQQETKTVLDARRAQTYDILLSEWYGDYLDPLTFLELWTTASEHNKTGWANAEYDRLLAQAAATIEPAARYATLRQAEALMLAESPITPLFHLPGNELRHPAVKGWSNSLLSLHPLKFVSLGD